MLPRGSGKEASVLTWSGENIRELDIPGGAPPFGGGSSTKAKRAVGLRGSFISFMKVHFLISSHPCLFLELTTTQDESTEMEHPSLLFFKRFYIVPIPPIILEVVVVFIL
jgi:hypothetical protein